ncbi:MAG: PglZ domain-containing protein [Saprospiraceae bacterium]
MIKEYIKDYFSQKLERKQSLVVYDKKLFYKELVNEIASDDIHVFDASENAVLAREEALAYWISELANSADKKMIVYVPFDRSIEEDDKVTDPYIIFSSGGAIFPDEAIDNYKEICLSALPDKSEKIAELFSTDSWPSFALIDALVDGNNYPVLKSLLGASSEAEILETILFPSPELVGILTKEKSWVKEIKQWASSILGYTIKGRSLDSISKELWSITLYSEFLYDLPDSVQIPESLAQVHKVSPNAKQLIFKVASSLRKNREAEEYYVKYAKEVSEELNLAVLFSKENDLGKVNTFSFEDSTFFNQFIKHLQNQEIQEAERIINNSSHSIWTIHDEERASSWLIAEKAIEIVSFINDSEPLIKKLTDLNVIIKWYAEKGYKLDALHREFEKTLSSVLTEDDSLKVIAKQIRAIYAAFTESIQKRFQSYFKEQGLQSIKSLHNLDLFEKKVKPFIKQAKKTAYILVDALRYELAKSLVERLERADFDLKIEPAIAFTPTVTKYGMAALMPDARKKLNLKIKSNKLEPFFDDSPINTRLLRESLTKAIYGDKSAWYWESDILSDDFDKDKDLFFITTMEIDNAGENLPDNALLLIEESMKKILKTCVKLRASGIEEFIIAADHGFVLTDSYKAGNNAPKPPGEWALNKPRCVVGTGSADHNHVSFTAAELGIKCEVDSFLYLKNYATYARGLKYFHEGLSLQECVTPCISFRAQKSSANPKIEVYLSYKGKDNGVITTRRPSVTIDSSSEGLLFGDPMDVSIEVLAGEKIVGKISSSSDVDSTTGFLEVIPGQNDKFTIVMDDDYEGEFTVYAKVPSTGLVLSQITLKTDYL